MSAGLRFRSLGVTRVVEALSSEVWIQMIRWKAPKLGLSSLGQRAQAGNPGGAGYMRVGSLEGAQAPHLHPGQGGTSW